MGPQVPSLELGAGSLDTTRRHLENPWHKIIDASLEVARSYTCPLQVDDRPLPVQTGMDKR